MRINFIFKDMKQEEPEYSEMIDRVKSLCEEYAACFVEIEKKERCVEIRRELHELSVSLRGKISIDFPGLLLCLLDIYEIIRDEAMLQEVLDVVSGNLEQLEVSAASVKLLAYCYYYVEEEECAERAGKMLEELKRRGVDEEELAEVGKVLEELTGNF